MLQQLSTDQAAAACPYTTGHCRHGGVCHKSDGHPRSHTIDKLHMIRAIVFDFDGLILDTELPEFQTWQEIYQAHGCTLSFAVWATCIGTVGAFDPYAYLEEQLGRAVDRVAVQAQQRQRCDALIAAQTVLPGVHDYLAEARRLGLHVGVASSSSRTWVHGHLTRLELSQHFLCI